MDVLTPSRTAYVDRWPSRTPLFPSSLQAQGLRDQWTTGIANSLVGSAIGISARDTGSDRLPVFAEISRVGIVTRLCRIRASLSTDLDLDLAEETEWHAF